MDTFQSHNTTHLLGMFLPNILLSQYLVSLFVNTIGANFHDKLLVLHDAAILYVLSQYYFLLELKTVTVFVCRFFEDEKQWYNTDIIVIAQFALVIMS